MQLHVALLSPQVLYIYIYLISIYIQINIHMLCVYVYVYIYGGARSGMLDGVKAPVTFHAFARGPALVAGIVLL